MRSEVKLVLGGKKKKKGGGAAFILQLSADFCRRALTVVFSVPLYRFSTRGAGKKSSAFGTPGATQNGKGAGEMGMSAENTGRWGFFAEALGSV